MATQKQLKYTHMAMIDLILQDPTVTTAELAEVFGYSTGWVTRVIASDSFQAMLASRRDQLVDPMIAQSLNERLGAIAMQSLEVVQQKLAAEESAAYAMQALGLAVQIATSAGAGKHVR